MKIVQKDFSRTDVPEECHQLQIETVGGVRLTLIEHPDGLGGITISADPIGENFISRLRQDEIMAHNVQVRVAGLRGVARNG